MSDGGQRHVGDGEDGHGRSGVPGGGVPGPVYPSMPGSIITVMYQGPSRALWALEPDIDSIQS